MRSLRETMELEEPLDEFEEAPSYAQRPEFWLGAAEKVGAATSAEVSQRRHEYYIRNRSALLQKSLQYKLQNKAILKRKQKAYRRRVQSGVQKQRQRITAGQRYIFGGFK